MLKIREDKKYLIWYKRLNETIFGKEFDNHIDAVNSFCSRPDLKNNYVKFFKGSDVPIHIKDRILEDDQI